jgi:hypothetical protein
VSWSFGRISDGQVRGANADVRDRERERERESKKDWVSIKRMCNRI